MVSKCANPACSTTFRYLHEGRIFTVRADLGHRRDGADPNVERYWLCSNCCNTMTLVMYAGRVQLRDLAAIPEAGIKAPVAASAALRHRSVA